MNSKPHRQNSDFQLRYFLAGSCKTPDGAYALMYGQKIDLEAKLRYAEAQRLKREARIAAAEEILADESAPKSKRLEAQAEIVEANADVPIWEMNLQAARDELATVDTIMVELEPLRSFAHLPILEANEACQREEWRLELQERAENFLMAHGHIPHDQLQNMRYHPDFESHIVPHIKLIADRLRTIQSPSEGLALLSNQPVLQQLKQDAPSSPH